MKTIMTMILAAATFSPALLANGLVVIERPGQIVTEPEAPTVEPELPAEEPEAPAEEDDHSDAIDAAEYLGFTARSQFKTLLRMNSIPTRVCFITARR